MSVRPRRDSTTTFFSVSGEATSPAVTSDSLSPGSGIVHACGEEWAALRASPSAARDWSFAASAVTPA
ncbi:hypothetical protein H6P81_003453 [Aristolochia fimbriata]|uniref:Uncharacterized protein n=1 Tax=Aristolochia fimbriata TaxID=158543 RepID=A0AAV7FCL7_ARIFI|nr:hypothetical protein H6P81_003453 [Aristolochia fimbriata]